MTYIFFGITIIEKSFEIGDEYMINTYMIIKITMYFIRILFLKYCALYLMEYQTLIFNNMVDYKLVYSNISFEKTP